MFIDNNGRFLGKINIIDLMALVILLGAALGIMMVQSGTHVTSGEVVEGETDINLTIFLRNVKVSSPDLFKPNESVHMTVRNQPRGDVKVVFSSFKARQMAIPTSGGNYKLVEDVIDPNGYDYQIVLRDHATVTSTGYVANGIKYKIGMPLEVEGFSFRLPAVIMDIQPVKQ